MHGSLDMTSKKSFWTAIFSVTAKSLSFFFVILRKCKCCVICFQHTTFLQYFIRCCMLHKIRTFKHIISEDHIIQKMYIATSYLTKSIFIIIKCNSGFQIYHYNYRKLCQKNLYECYDEHFQCCWKGYNYCWLVS